MQSRAFPPSQQDTVRAAIQAMRGTLIVADALLQHGRVIDLVGLDGEVMRICDAALALPTTEGAALKDDLVLLLQQTMELEARVRR